MKGRDRQSKATTSAANLQAAGARAHRIRIIGGMWKRTPIPVGASAELRPTPDRVRETLFNWLTFLRPDMSRLRGLDLFAGTGALGFELASRGAARVVLVERDAGLRRQQEALRAKLGAAERIEIIGGEALSVAQRLDSGTFDLVFIDPPFGSELLGPSLQQARRLVDAEGLIYVEWGEALDQRMVARHGLAIIRAGRAGRVAFHLLARADDQ